MVMKKITFNADADLLELAKRIAEEKGTTLEEEVRQWLKDLRRRQVETHSARAEESQKAQIDGGLRLRSCTGCKFRVSRSASPLRAVRHPSRI
jgi:CHASE3 domain sensor protein